MLIMIIASLSGLAIAQGTTEKILFNGFVEDDLVCDQYMVSGVRFLQDPNGDPIIDIERIEVYAPGIQKATLTTPLIQPTSGCFVDTLNQDGTTVPPAGPSSGLQER